MSSEQDYISNIRTATKKFWDAYHELKNAQTQWDALNYSATLPDGEGANLGYTAAEVGAVVFDTMNEVKLRIFDTGHKTNLAKLL